MVTINPAGILKWDEELGSIAPGRRADLMVVAGTSGDPYDRLIGAREDQVTLAVIDGWPRYGSPETMRPFPVTESKTVAGAPRRFNLAHGAADPLVRDVTVSEAESRLETA